MCSFLETSYSILVFRLVCVESLLRFMTMESSCHDSKSLGNHETYKFLSITGGMG